MPERDEPYDSRDFHFLAALTQEGIDGARLALDRIRAQARGESGRALDLVATKLDEAELWLGRAIEREAQAEPNR